MSVRHGPLDHTDPSISTEPCLQSLNFLQTHLNLIQLPQNVLRLCILSLKPGDQQGGIEDDLGDRADLDLRKVVDLAWVSGSRVAMDS